jgi:hypothetical protein
MVALNGGLLERSVHPLNLTIGPRMVWLGQPVLDAVRITEHVEHWARQRAVGPRRFIGDR